MSRSATPRDLIPETHCVMATMLRPFSLGHHLLFTRLNLPFEGNAAVITPPHQLALAVFLCSAPYSQTLEALLRGELEAEHARWLKALKPRWWQRTRFRHDDEAEKFARYLADGYRRAPVWRHGSGIALSAPWECLLTCRLRAAGFSEREVMEGYLPANWYHYHTLHELKQADNYDPKHTRWNRVFWTAQDDAWFRRPMKEAN